MKKKILWFIFCLGVVLFMLIIWQQSWCNFLFLAVSIQVNSLSYLNDMEEFKFKHEYLWIKTVKQDSEKECYKLISALNQKLTKSFLINSSLFSLLSIFLVDQSEKGAVIQLIILLMFAIAIKTIYKYHSDKHPKIQLEYDVNIKNGDIVFYSKNEVLSSLLFEIVSVGDLIKIKCLSTKKEYEVTMSQLDQEFSLKSESV